jgi:hypothetical protein
MWDWHRTETSITDTDVSDWSNRFDRPTLRSSDER